MITARHIAVIRRIAFMIFFFFLLVVVPALPAAHAESRGFRGSMIRRTGTTTTINFTQAARESHRRLTFLTVRSGQVIDKSSSASRRHLNISNTETVPAVPLWMDGGGGAYDMEFSLGTPPQKLTALADTGSDLIWTKCGGGGGMPQGTSSSPSYHPDASSTFTKLPCSDRLCTALQSDSLAWCAAAGAECDYMYSYGLGGGDDDDDRSSYTQGFLGSETFTLGGDAVHGVGFGCTTTTEGDFGEGSGLIGLGRGPLSLVSQLNAGTFMYCLTSNASKPSPLLFGSLATLPAGTTTTGGVQSTGLLPSTTFYAVNLRSISIGSATTPGVDAPDGGVVFDSGTTLTFLAEPAYTAAKTAFMSQTNLTRVDDDGSRDDGFEACYRKPSNGGDRLLESDVPAMVLHFDGGADMALPVANYVVEVDDGVLCWVVQKSPSLSIIGNVMQTNYLVLHDVRRSVLSFQPANCDSYKANEASGSHRRPCLYQFSITMLLCFYIYLYTSILY